MPANFDVEAMWKRAGADTAVTVPCPHAKHTVSTVTDLAAGVRTSADLMNLGLQVDCHSIVDAVKAEFKYFSETKNVTAQVFVEKLGYTIARGILRGIFSERNPRLFYEFLRSGPKDSYENLYTTLVKPFSMGENSVYSADMIKEKQVKAILQDYRHFLAKHMTVGQQHALLHVQRQMQRQHDDLKEQRKIDADRKKIVDERKITPNPPPTSKFKPTPKKPTGAPPILGGYSSFLRGETPLIAVSDANTVVVPLGMPEPPSSVPLPGNTASMAMTPSAAADVSIVATGKTLTKPKKKKATKTNASRSRAKPKRAASKPLQKKSKRSSASSAASKLMMLGSDEDEEKIDSAAKLAVSPLSLRRKAAAKKSSRKANYTPPPKLVRQTNRPVAEDEEEEERIDSAAKLAVSPNLGKYLRKPPLLMLGEDDDTPPPPKLVRQTNKPPSPPHPPKLVRLTNELPPEMRPAEKAPETDLTAKPKAKKRRSRATRKKGATNTAKKKSTKTKMMDAPRDAKRRKTDEVA